LTDCSFCDTSFLDFFFNQEIQVLALFASSFLRVICDFKKHGFISHQKDIWAGILPGKLRQ
jgi:hypothetical protein